MGELLWEGFKRSIRTKEANTKIDNKRQKTYEIEKKFNDSFEDSNKLYLYSHKAIRDYHMYRQLDNLSMEELQAADEQIRTSLDQLAMLDSDPGFKDKVDIKLIDVVNELGNVMDQAIKQMKAMNAKEKIDTKNTNDGIDTKNAKEEIPSQDKIAKLGTKGKKAIEAMDKRSSTLKGSDNPETPDTGSKNAKENLSILKGSDNPETLNKLKESLNDHLNKISDLARQHLQTEHNSAKKLLADLRNSNWIEEPSELMGSNYVLKSEEHLNKLNEALNEVDKLSKGKIYDNSFKITVEGSSKPQDKVSADKLFKAWKDLTDAHKNLKKHMELKEKTEGLQSKVSEYLSTLSEEMSGWIKDQKIYKKFDQRINDFMKNFKNVPKDLASDQTKSWDLIREHKELSENLDDIKKVIRFKDAVDKYDNSEGPAEAILQALEQFKRPPHLEQYYNEASRGYYTQLAEKRSESYEDCINAADGHLRSISKNAEVWMCCKLDHFINMLKTDSIESAFTLNPEAPFLKQRVEVERASYGLPEDLPEELRCRFAFWTEDSDGQDHNGDLAKLGPIRIRFTDDITRRSTATMTNSLACYTKGRLYCKPVPCSEPTREFFPVETYDSSDRSFKQNKENLFTVKKFYNVCPYVEVQIWGRLRPSRHIAEVVFIKSDHNPNLEKEQHNLLASYKITPRIVEEKNWLEEKK